MKKHSLAVILSLFALVASMLNATAAPIPAGQDLIRQTAESLRQFSSIPAYKSWALRRVSNISLDISSSVLADSGGYGWSWIYDDKSPSIDGMADKVSSQNLSFRIVQYGIIEANVRYVDTNWMSLFEGTASFWPWNDEKTGGWQIPEDFGPQVQIAQSIKVSLPGVGNLEAILTNYGNPESNIYIRRNPFNGEFEIPRSVIGNAGTFVVTPIGSTSNSDRFAIRIADGVQIPIEHLNGKIRPSIAGTQVLTNATVINIKPRSINYRGEDILTEANYTAFKAGVVINPITSEGEVAEYITIVDVKTGTSQNYYLNLKNADNGPKSITLDFPKGRFHIYAKWRNFKDDTAQDDGQGYPPYFEGKG